MMVGFRFSTNNSNTASSPGSPSVHFTSSPFRCCCCCCWSSLMPLALYLHHSLWLCGVCLSVSLAQGIHSCGGRCDAPATVVVVVSSLTNDSFVFLFCFFSRFHILLCFIIKSGKRRRDATEHRSSLLHRHLFFMVGITRQILAFNGFDC